MSAPRDRRGREADLPSSAAEGRDVRAGRGAGIRRRASGEAGAVTLELPGRLPPILDKRSADRHRRAEAGGRDGVAGVARARGNPVRIVRGDPGRRPPGRAGRGGSLHRGSVRRRPSLGAGNHAPMAPGMGASDSTAHATQQPPSHGGPLSFVPLRSRRRRRSGGGLSGLRRADGLTRQNPRRPTLVLFGEPVSKAVGRSPSEKPPRGRSS